jgi:hypothetical protein
MKDQLYVFASAKEGNLDIAELLISKGADVMQKIKMVVQL